MTATRASAKAAPAAAAAKTAGVSSRDAVPRRTPAFVAKAPLPFRLGGGASKLPAASPGTPLAASISSRLEASLGADFGAVRVHTDAEAARSAGAMGARAYTVGSEIFLGAGERADDLELMGHEAAHVVQQQGGAGAAQGFSGEGNGALEGEASQASAAVALGESFAVRGRTGTTGPQMEGTLDFVESAAWSLLGKVAPELVPILKKGPEGALDWLKEKISAAFEALFNFLMAPVRAIGGIGKWLQTQFAPLLAWMQDAAAKIARNDCSPLREAADKIEQVAAAIITPIVEKLQFVAHKVGDVFKAIWAKIGAPVWDWIKQYAGKQWDAIKLLASWVWDKAEPVRKLADRAWKWLKNKIGIGDGPEGQNGILQWVQGKAEWAWNWFKAKLEPYKKQLTTVAAVVAGVLVLISPAGPVLVIGGIVIGVIQGVRWIKANWGKGNLVVQARTYLEKTLIPSLLSSLKKMTAAVTKMATSINGKLGELTASAGNIVGAVAESVLHFAVEAMQWVADQIIALAQWGTDKLQALSKWIEDALGRLHKFLEPFIAFLGKVGSLLLDIYGLPLLLAGKLWEMIPKCIRDPFVDWIVPLILGQIEIFQELVKDPPAWQKTKADAMNIVRLVFVKKELKGAIRAIFDLVLRIFNLPLELLVEVKDKALKAWDDVTKGPINFIKNCVRVLGRGLQRYGKAIKTHLKNGIEGWLFGEIKEKGVRKPSSWTNVREVFGFVLDVLGLSMDHVFTLMKKTIPDKKVEALRKWWGRLTRAWDWIQENLNKSPQDVTTGLIGQAKDFGIRILEGVVIWIAQQVAVELAAEATAAAASAGLSEVVSAVRRIWLAIKAAVKWLRQIVDMVNRALDAIANIVAGIIEPGAVVLEDSMDKATPAVIGILAGMVGLGGVGAFIRGLIDSLREAVDTAILWMIAKCKKVIDGVLLLVGGVAGRLKAWWQKRRVINAGGETHTLSFKGGEDEAELTVESSPKRIQAFVDDARLARPASDKSTLDAIEAQVTVVRDARASLRKLKKKGASDAEMQTDTDKLDEAFDKIGNGLERLFAGSEEGTQAHPIPLDWPKPRWDHYLPLYLYRVGAESAPAFQITGRRDPAKILVKTYLPTGAHIPANVNPPPPAKLDQLGIKGRFQIHQDSEVGPLSTVETPGGGLINGLLEEFGWSAEREARDGDHLLEMQFGGENILANLWPLEAKQNRGAGSALARQYVKLGKEKISVDLLKKVKLSAEDKAKKFRFKIQAVAS